MDTNSMHKKLTEGKWSSKFLCKLSLFDHIRECLEKDNHLKALDIPKTDEKYEALDKELMDLKIILDLYFNESTELYEKRLSKFYDNLNK